ncbi:ABC transporter permease [Gudongella sp. SC589]|jgi:peptide/nickel transport system permease protein|uniref:ABC transporter permease n=1 Tax=Gudongella sp. SC589 TaxID=3385990 RepID=UPI003904828F
MTDSSNELTKKKEELKDKGHISSSRELGDEQRVRVLSPGMLVVKRFIRNRLAIIGLVIISFMFLFSFLGGILSPYDETQVFKHIGTMSKEYASVTHNEVYRFTGVQDSNYTGAAHSQFVLARNAGRDSFSHGEDEYYISEEANDLYRVFTSIPIATILNFRGVMSVNPMEGESIPPELEATAKLTLDNREAQFLLEGEVYTIRQSGREYILGRTEPVAVESKYIIDPAEADADIDYEFAYESEIAFRAGNVDSFEAGGIKYQIEREENLGVIYREDGGNMEEYAIISRLSIQPISQDVFLTVDFKKALSNAIENRERSFLFPDLQGNEKEYELSRLNNVYTVKTETETHLISIHEQPSWEHWLGTDKHGMDVLTRLMYGGRISLTIGFIVVLLESILGIIMGGLAGYFGKWVDMLIMRIVDVFNCIPFLPLLIILGAVMDQLEVAPQLRIYFLMLILGLMSWPGIARMVRGQILSLREQEFMLAAEATGISVSRRIFKHLIPNVIPQLIVFATMGLGSVILYESTLSFLGLGVKFPLASWGNIISGVSTAYEMTNFWFVWIPAGMLILLTVLGFNFVGDGLRDAFDPKMKR